MEANRLSNPRFRHDRPRNTSVPTTGRSGGREADFVCWPTDARQRARQPSRGAPRALGALALCRKTRLAGDLACLDAGRADVEALRGLADHRVHGLDVRVEAALRAPVRVRDRVTETRSLAADVAVGSQGGHSKSRRWSRPTRQSGRSGGSKEATVRVPARPGNRRSVTDQRRRRPTGRICVIGWLPCGQRTLHRPLGQGPPD